MYSIYIILHTQNANEWMLKLEWKLDLEYGSEKYKKATFESSKFIRILKIISTMGVSTEQKTAQMAALSLQISRHLRTAHDMVPVLGAGLRNMTDSSKIDDYM